MSAWVKFNDTGVRSHPITKNFSVSAADGWIMERETDNKLYLVTGNGFQGTTNTFTDTTKFHHIVMTFNAGAVAIYYDGVNQALAAPNGLPASLPTSTNPLLIGRDGSNAGPSYVKGLMDDVRIYNRALSADEIKRLYNIGGTVKLNTTLEGPKNGLVGWWTFDGKDISGVQTYDRSGNANRGILTNGPSRTIGKIGQGLRFDGVDDYVEIPHNDALNPPSSGGFSISLWFNRHGAGA